MTRIKLPHVDAFADRHGRVRYYFRRGRGARTPLPGIPGSAEFMAAYQAAMAEQPAPAPGKTRGAPGTFDRLAQDYFASPEFLRLRPSSRTAFRHAIERILEHDGLGPLPVAGLTRQRVKTLMGRWGDTPAAANNNLKRLRALIRVALDQDLITTNPTTGVARFKVGTHHTWTETEITAYEAHWPIGTPQRTAFALLLYTGQRRGDVVGMVWPDIDHGLVRVVQQKTAARVAIPVHPDLTRALAGVERRHVVILTTGQTGKPYSAAGFGNFMAAAIAAAGLPDRCVTHGLRKAAARRLAESGATTKEIGAILGDKSLSEIERYSAAADQEKLAHGAMARLTGEKSGTPNPKPKPIKSQTGGKTK